MKLCHLQTIGRVLNCITMGHPVAVDLLEAAQAALEREHGMRRNRLMALQQAMIRRANRPY